MAEPAYITLSEDDVWTLYYGDGSESERWPLAVGQPFVPGDAIREAVAELAAWAEANGYTVVTPAYSATNIRLEDLIEPEIFDEVFGLDDEPEA